MKKMLVVLIFCLISLILLTACAPVGRGYVGNEAVWIYSKGSLVGTFKLDCEEPLTLVSGQYVNFTNNYTLKLVSGNIILRKLSSGIYQLDTYVSGESVIRVTGEKGENCQLKVIVKPSPYSE